MSRRDQTRLVEEGGALNAILGPHKRGEEVTASNERRLWAFSTLPIDEMQHEAALDVGLRSLRGADMTVLLYSP